MPKYYVEFTETQIHAYGYYADAESPEEAYEDAEARYYNGVPPDSTQVIDSRYLTHNIERA